MNERPFYFTLSLCVLSIMLGGCTLSNAQAPVFQPPSAQMVSLNTLCSSLEGSLSSSCTLAVTVKSVNGALAADVRVEAATGIVFLPSEQMAIDDSHKNAVAADLVLLQEESRKFQLPFEIDPEIAFSGAYQISAELRQKSSDGQGKVLVQKTELVYIEVLSPGEARIINEEDFAKLHKDFPVISGVQAPAAYTSSGGLPSAKIILPDDPQPTVGMLMMYYPASGESAPTTITVRVNGGLVFTPWKGLEIEESGRAVRIATGPLISSEKRLLAIPFSVDVKSLDGAYAFIVEFNSGKTIVTKQLPTVITINSSITQPKNKWFSI